MSAFLNYFTGSNKKDQQQQTSKISNCPKSLIQLQEIDFIDQQQEHKPTNCLTLDQYKDKKKQLKQDSNQQKSISSGEFQQMNDNDDQNEKKSNNKINIQPPSKQDPCLQINNMQDTFQFRDQINQSISQTHLLKRPFRNSLPKTNQMSFSDINQYHQNTQISQQSIKETKIQASIIKIQYPNMSESFQSNDFNKQIEESFEDFSQNYSISKSKNNTVTSETVAKCFDLLGIGNNASSFKNQQNRTVTQEKQSQIFFPKNQFNIAKEQNKKTQNPFDDNFNAEEQQDQIFDVNKSLIAEKIKPINFKNNEKKVSPTKHKNLNSKERQSFENQQRDDQNINVQQSFYMAKVQQKPIKISSIKLDSNKKKAQTQIQVPFLIYLKDSLFFIKYGQTPDRRLTDKIFQSLAQTFLIKNIMLPFFSLKLLEDYEGQIQIGVKKQKQEVFSFYANIYFDFLHKKYQMITKQFFQKEVEKNQGKSKFFDAQVGLKKEDSSAILGTFYKKVIDYFKLSHYSKAQILKDSLQSQLAFISEYKQKWVQSESQSPQNQKKSEVKVQKMNVKVLENMSLDLLQQISGLQLLISFQKSEMYCEDKLKQKLQENIWKQRKKKLIQDRNWFISNLFSVCQI